MKQLIFGCFLLLTQVFGYQDDLESHYSTYLEQRFLNKIDRSQIKTIFEVGSLHALDAILLQKYYNCPVYAFECNPINIERIKMNIHKYDSSVALIEKAVSEKTDFISFYACVTHPSTSSLYPFDYESMENNNQGKYELLKKK